MNKYGLTNQEMFEFFNKPVLQDAITYKKAIRFSHNPVNDDGFLGMEWEFIKSILNITDKNLVKIGDMWYVQ